VNESAVARILEDVRARGLSLTASGEDLRLQGPRERMDAELVGRIKTLKPDLLAHLLLLQSAERRDPEQVPVGFGVTGLQRAYLVGRGDALDLGGVSSHIYHEIEGYWDLDRLESALRSVVARHGMLRTRFTAEGRQVEEPSVEVRIGRLDLRALSKAEQTARLEKLREQLSHRVLPADRAPLLAADVTLLAEDRMVLHVGHDGLIMDGISMFLFFQAWWTAYTDGDAAAGTEAGAGNAPAEASFEAYIKALETARTRSPYQRSRSYWLERIDRIAPYPELPLRSSPGAIARTRFTQHVARLDASAWGALKARAARRGLTPTAVLLAAYAQALSRWGAGPAFTLASTLANRPPIHPRISEAIGNFSETMLVEVEIDRGLGFADWAKALQAQLRQGIDNRHFSGIEVLRELARRQGTARATMPYTFNSAIGYLQGDLDGSTLELFGREVYTSSQTPQLWLNAFAFEQHGGVIVQLDSVDGLFPEGLIEGLIAGYQTLLDSLARGGDGSDGDDGVDVGEGAWSARTFDLLPEPQRERRRAANDTVTALPEAQRLTDAFVAQALARPEASAILTERASMSYGELLERARAAASWLQGQGVARNELVGLVMTRGPEQVVGILATLLADAAYLPIDATLPAARRRHMLRDGRVRCVLTNSDVSEDVSEDELAVLTLDASSPVQPSAQGDLHQDSAADADDGLAYVLYTSGTTGEPKGVMVGQRGVLNLVADCNARFGISAGDRFLAISAFNFDLSVYDVFGALSAGAALVLPEADRAADPAHWLDLCAKNAVTVWNSVPAIAALLHDQAVADALTDSDTKTDTTGPLAALRLMLLSGDRIPPDLPARLRRLTDGLSVVSLGGPTETTVWNICHPVGAEEDGSRPIPYGRPNANNRAYILDQDGLDAPDWVTGEICAAGTGLALGYWGDPERTAARFVRDERLGEQRLYRTGDLGRYLPDGEIEILGRGDFQLKVNGYRIEAGEVETRLVELPAVQRAVVVRQSGAREEPTATDTGDRLVAHLVPTGTARPAAQELRVALREFLPEYMLPSAVVWHERLPLTRNGKVDRRSLMSASAPAPAASSAETGSSTGSDAAAQNAADAELEDELRVLWASVLRISQDAVSRDADFYDLGGDSLAAARILTGVRKQFAVGITLDRLHEVQTVRAMAARIADVRSEPAVARRLS
jgi:amino acid adenylation domain-containing protein